MAPDHDVIEQVHLSHGARQFKCRCGKSVIGRDEDDAREKHERHHLAETTGKPGLEAARRALEGEK